MTKATEMDRISKRQGYPPMASFADFCSKDDLEAMARHSLSQSGHDWTQARVWIDAYQKMVIHFERTSMRNFLAALNNEGKLKPIEGTEGRSIDFVAKWNAMVNGEPSLTEDNWFVITRAFTVEALYQSISKLLPQTDSMDIDAIYKKLVDLMDKGDFRRTKDDTIHNVLNRFYDETNDADFVFDVVDWQITMLEHKDGVFAPMTALNNQDTTQCRR